MSQKNIIKQTHVNFFSKLIFTGVTNFFLKYFQTNVFIVIEIILKKYQTAVFQNLVFQKYQMLYFSNHCSSKNLNIFFFASRFFQKYEMFSSANLFSYRNTKCIPVFKQISLQNYETLLFPNKCSYKSIKCFINNIYLRRRLRSNICANKCTQRRQRIQVQFCVPVFVVVFVHFNVFVVNFCLFCLLLQDHSVESS